MTEKLQPIPMYKQEKDGARKIDLRTMEIEEPTQVAEVRRDLFNAFRECFFRGLGQMTIPKEDLPVLLDLIKTPRMQKLINDDLYVAIEIDGQDYMDVQQDSLGSFPNVRVFEPNQVRESGELGVRQEQARWIEGMVAVKQIPLIKAVLSKQGFRMGNFPDRTD